MRGSQLLLVCAIGCTGGPGAASDGSGDADGDAASSDPCESAATGLCLTFAPEAIRPEPEPSLDGRGFLRVQVFDSPKPPGGEDAKRFALLETTIPADFGEGTEISVDELPRVALALDDAPSTVFVRAVFFDEISIAPSAVVGVAPGAWLAGVDLSRGFEQTPTLMPVRLTPGETTFRELALTAQRRLRVTVTRSVEPVGDGEGPLSVVASRVEALPPLAETHGYGIDPCVDVTTGPQTIDVALVGSGTFFVTAFFEDLLIDTTGTLPPGTMISVDGFDPVTGTGVFDRIDVATEQYSAALSVDLGFVSALPGDPNALGPNSCVDLGLVETP